MIKDPNRQKNTLIHQYYEEYILNQRIIGLDIGETITITTKDQSGNTLDEETFTSQFINSHFNFAFQDKGEKSDLSNYEYRLVPKE